MLKTESDSEVGRQRLQTTDISHLAVQTESIQIQLSLARVLDRFQLQHSKLSRHLRFQFSHSVRVVDIWLAIRLDHRRSRKHRYRVGA